MCSRAAPFEPSESEIDFFPMWASKPRKTSSASTRRPPPHLAGC